MFTGGRNRGKDKETDRNASRYNLLHFSSWTLEGIEPADLSFADLDRTNPRPLAKEIRPQFAL
jgi:hypothetical protein